VDTSPKEVNLSVDASLAPQAPFRALFDSEFGYVCRALRRLGVQHGDLEDVAQELFVTVYRDFGQYEPRQALRPWLFSYALRFAANYRRLARNRGHVSDSALAELRAAGDGKAEARDSVLRALAVLDFDFRTVLVMHDLEGFDAPEIAAQLGIPLNTVYSRLRRARAEFRGVIDALHAKGGAS
jgi:RNA polymerase sigma-70 factor (ECF subfamily)